MPTQVITPPATHQISTADGIFGVVFDQSHNFRIELNHEQALAFIRRIDRYNEFEAGAVIDALERADRLIPRMKLGPGHPNNGSRDYRISVGRERSPVIYLERLEFNGKPKLDDATMKAICQEMELSARADEADYRVVPLVFCAGRKIEFRFWWD